MRVKSTWAILPLLILSSVCMAQSPAGWVVVSGDKCNLRSGPASSNRVVKVLPKFTPLKLLGESENGYYAAQTAKSAGAVKGWAHESVIGKNGYISIDTKGLAKVNVRTGPSQDNDPAFTLKSGWPLRVIGRKAEYIHIVDFEGDTGWIHENFASLNHFCIVNAVDKEDMAELYAGPRKDYEVVARAEKETVLRVLRQQGEWVEVKHEDGSAGWIPITSIWGVPGDEEEDELDPDSDFD